VDIEQLIGNSLGRYQILEQMGKDEITRVYKAYDQKLDRLVVIKLLANSQHYSPEFIEYFLREARALAGLSHANIAKVLDFGQESGYLFLVIEYVSQRKLRDILGQPLDWQKALHLMIPMAEALEYAHHHKVIHRDLKPENILLSEDGQPVLSDFSVARLVEVEETREGTGTTVGLGSPSYMSPEQGKGVEVDSRADIYALGVVLFEMVTGRLPFVAESSMEVVIQQVTNQPPSPRKFAPDLPAAVEKIILTALQKDPEGRFQSAGDLLSALRQVIQTGEFSVARQKKPLPAWLPWVIAVLGLLVLAALILVLIGWRPGQRRVQEATSPPVAQGIETQAMAAEVMSQPTSTLAASRTPTLVEAPRSQETPTPTVQPEMDQPTVSPYFRFADYPEMPQNGFPALGDVISPQNAANLQELVRWVKPYHSNMKWTEDNSRLWSATSAGVYLYGASNLIADGFFHVPGWLTYLDGSRDGLWIATGDRSGMIRLWDTQTGHEKFTLAGHTAEITELAFSPDGKRLVSASVDHNLRIWDVTQGKEIAVLKKHAYTVNTLAFTPDGKHIISGSDDFQILTWDAETGELLDNAQSAGMILDLVITGNQKTLVTGLNNATVEVWDLAASKRVQTLRDPGQVTPVYSLSTSPNNQLLAAGGGDGIVRIWNLTSGQLLRQFPSFTGPEGSKSDEIIIDVAFSPDGTRLAVLTDAGTATIWNINTLEQVVKNTLAWQSIQRVSLSPNGKVMAYQVGSQSVTFWLIDQKHQLAVVPEIMPRGTIFSPDNMLAVLASGDQLHVYSLGTSSLSLLRTMKGFPVKASVVFLPDVKIMAAGSSRQVMLWSVASGRLLNQTTYKYQNNCQVAFAENGDFLAAGSNIGVFQDAKAYPWLCQVTRSTRTQDETYLEQAGFLAFGFDNKQVDLWHNIDGNSTNQLIQAGDGKIYAVALSPDGKLIATAGADGLIRLWDLATNEVVRILDHHSAPVKDVVFSQDGKLILTASEDGSIEAWGLLP